MRPFSKVFLKILDNLAYFFPAQWENGQPDLKLGQNESEALCVGKD